MAQTHISTDGHGNSKTNSAQWGQVGEKSVKSEFRQENHKKCKLKNFSTKVGSILMFMLLKIIDLVNKQQNIFTNSAPLGRVGHRVAMSVRGCVCLRHRVYFFSRPLIGPQIT